MGRTLQDVIREWVTKLNNREIGSCILYFVMILEYYSYDYNTSKRFCIFYLAYISLCILYTYELFVSSST